ncbi:MAG: DUF3883 domain-containing protein, partial [Candidatus Heimdallarchaeota archaeon]|nr:DUF3883 domain-containing protein [Candidatus Heimdallarchaeota archaeon]
VEPYEKRGGGLGGGRGGTGRPSGPRIPPLDVEDEGLRVVKDFEEKNANAKIKRANKRSGYDLKSIRADGDRLIEVKATTGSSLFPFIMEMSEINRGKREESNYWIYRVLHVFSDIEDPVIKAINDPYLKNIVMDEKTRVEIKGFKKGAKIEEYKSKKNDRTNLTKKP